MRSATLTSPRLCGDQIRPAEIRLMDLNTGVWAAVPSAGFAARVAEAHALRVAEIGRVRLSMWGEAALRLERRMREGGHVSTVIKSEATTRTEGVPKTFGTAPLLLSGARGVPVEARETLEVRRSAAGALAQGGRRRRCGCGRSGRDRPRRGDE
jgi:hypothetical protein